MKIYRGLAETSTDVEKYLLDLGTTATNNYSKRCFKNEYLNCILFKNMRK